MFFQTLASSARLSVPRSSHSSPCQSSRFRLFLGTLFTPPLLLVVRLRGVSWRRRSRYGSTSAVPLPVLVIAIFPQNAVTQCALPNGALLLQAQCFSMGNARRRMVPGLHKLRRASCALPNSMPPTVKEHPCIINRNLRSSARSL